MSLIKLSILKKQAGFAEMIPHLGTALSRNLMRTKGTGPIIANIGTTFGWGVGGKAAAMQRGIAKVVNPLGLAAGKAVNAVGNAIPTKLHQPLQMLGQLGEAALL